MDFSIRKISNAIIISGRDPNGELYEKAYEFSDPN